MSARADTLMTLFLRRLTRPRLDAFRDRRVRDLVAHAYRRVPYYRRLLVAAGVQPGDVRGVADLARIPVSTRQAIQALPAAEIVAGGITPDALIASWSSGSTGRRLTVRRTWGEERLLRALRNRVGRRMGRRIWERGARLAVPERVRAHDARRPSSLLPRLGLYRDRTIDCLADPEEIVGQLRAFRPQVIGGFPPVLLRVARHVGPAGLADLGVRALVVGGEVLTPSMRRCIEAAFRAPVAETYGSIEFIQQAWECPAGRRMHVCDESVVLELLRDGRPVSEGEVGEVVVTGLHGYAMPLIRYQIGDLARQGAASCPCGAPCSTLLGVQGRMLDYFPLPDGRTMHPYELTLPMQAAHPWIVQYQLTQERRDRVVLRLVPEPRPSADVLACLRRQCAERLGAGVTLEIQLVDDLCLESSGKFRVARSLVHSPYDAPAGEHT